MSRSRHKKSPLLKTTAIHPGSNPDGQQHPISPDGHRSFEPFDQVKKAAYLDALRKYPVIRYACEVARVSRQTVLNHRRSDPEFAKAEELAKEEGIERLEVDVMRRANSEDVERPSDLLSMFVLKAHKPGLYRDRVDHRSEGSVRHEVIVNLLPPGEAVPEDDYCVIEAQCGTEDD